MRRLREHGCMPKVSVEIPKTATGKFDKKRLRETVEDPALPYAPGEGDGE